LALRQLCSSNINFVGAKKQIIQISNAIYLKFAGLTLFIRPLIKLLKPDAGAPQQNIAVIRGYLGATGISKTIETRQRKRSKPGMLNYFSPVFVHKKGETY
jgi:hypothetical protein